MYHFETLDYKTNKHIIIEDEDLKNVLNIILKHDNKKFSDNENSNVIFEDCVGNKLLEISEKYLKVALGITKLRKSIKLDKIIEDFNKLNFKNVATITFQNLIHDGVITIWEHSSSDSIYNESDDEYLDNDVMSSCESEYSVEQSMKMKNIEISKKQPKTTSKPSTRQSTKPSTNPSTKPLTKISTKTMKELEAENKKLREQIDILKGFVETYRQMSLKMNKEAENVIKTV
jgi:hypothetical protein